MTTRILVMGLPRSGKTALARELSQELIERGFTVEWFNADDVRKRYKDWDFSIEGRIRQSQRMRELADKSTADFVICDFIAPLEEMRTAYAANTTIWLDTVDESQYKDTDAMFVPPTQYEHRIMERSAKKWAPLIADRLKIKFEHQQEGRLRSLIKTVSWRILGSSSTFAISWFITGNVIVAGTIFGLHFFANSILYYLHERVWNKIKWGKHAVNRQ